MGYFNTSKAYMLQDVDDKKIVRVKMCCLMRPLC